MGEKVMEVVVGRVDVGGEGEAPPAPSTPAIEAFVEEHRKLKKIIDDFGKQGLCVTRGTLERKGGVKGEDLDRHIHVFRGSDAASPITEEGKEVLCGKKALSALKKKMKIEMGGGS